MGFAVLGIAWNTGDGTDLNALRRFKVSYALGASMRIDLVVLFAHRNCLIGALRFAHVAVDAFVGDEQCHGGMLLESGRFKMVCVQMFKGLLNVRMHKLRHIAPEAGNFAHQGRRNEFIVFGGG